MKKAALTLALILFSLALAAPPAAATSFVMTTDEALVERAPVVVEAEILSVDGAPVSGTPSTDYLIEVQRVHKGTVPGSNLVVRVPGGIGPDGIGLKIWGAPSFRPGERALLFLRPTDDGTFRITELMLGAFHETRAGDETLFVRSLAGAHEVQAPGEPAGSRERFHQPRLRDAFVQWIGERASGLEAPADYFYRPEPGAPPIESPVSTSQPFTVFCDDPETEAAEPAGPDGVCQPGSFELRWFTFEEGTTERWRVHQDGQPGLTEQQAIDALGQGIASWNGDPGSDVRYGLGSPATTSDSGGLTDFDGENVLLFGNPNDNDLFDGVFSCTGGGGVLAIGGPWFPARTEDLVIWPRTGRQYLPILSADIITNEGLECFFNVPDPQLLAAQLFGHELGHTLGLGHSCGDSESPPCSSDPQADAALMNAFIGSATRGPGLEADDRDGIRHLYGTGSTGSPPIPPSDLAAELTGPTSVLLTWTDNSNDETEFRVQEKIGNGSFTTRTLLPADAESATLTGLAAETEHSWRVRARNAAGGSGFSNVVTLTTPSGLPVPPSGLVATPASPTVILLSWTDNSVSETGFSIEASSPVATYEEVGVAAQGATSFPVSVVTGRPYTFRVRARNGGGVSEASNEASATAQADPTAPCFAGEETLCLLDDRFRVEVDWRDQINPGGNNGPAEVQVSPVGGSKTGVLSFFDANNIELIVKALDATNPETFPDPSYWFFYGALSTVEYWITVTDTQTGDSNTYHNPPGELCGLPDTSAFPVPSTPVTGSPLALREAAHRERVRSLEAPTRIVRSLPGTAEPCVPSATTLCLHEGRFAVSVDWTDQRTLESGDGTAVTGSDRSGYFWFFNQDNIELVVKILDNTSSPANNWWVFYGALSDVMYTLTVLDTEHNVELSYVNEPGDFCGNADTQGFED